MAGFIAWCLNLVNRPTEVDADTAAIAANLARFANDPQASHDMRYALSGGDERAAHDRWLTTSEGKAWSIKQQIEQLVIDLQYAETEDEFQLIEEKMRHLEVLNEMGILGAKLDYLVDQARPEHVIDLTQQWNKNA